jgi:hypothetical protein
MKTKRRDGSYWTVLIIQTGLSTQSVTTCLNDVRLALTASQSKQRPVCGHTRAVQLATSSSLPSVWRIRRSQVTRSERRGRERLRDPNAAAVQGSKIRPPWACKVAWIRTPRPRKVTRSERHGRARLDGAECRGRARHEIRVPQPRKLTRTPMPRKVTTPNAAIRTPWPCKVSRSERRGRARLQYPNAAGVAS